VAIITPLLGALRGKLGGVVFQRSRGGLVARAHVRAVDPRTQAQTWSRSRLSAASRLWHSQTDAGKAAWDTYAATFYQPRDGRQPGVSYTGQQAYTGSRYLAICCKDTAAQMVIVTDPPGAGVTLGTQNIPQNAPTLAYEAAWKVDGTPRALVLRAAQISLPNQFFLEIGWESGVIAGIPPITSDPHSGEFTSLHVLLSLQSQQPHGWQARRRSMAVVTCPPITGVVGWTPSDHITLQLTARASIIERISQFPIAGGALRLTCVAVSSNTAQARVIGDLAVPI
jgi:hypothetical protein